MRAPEQRKPASLPADGDALEKLLKIDAATSLPGYSDGLQAAYAYTPEDWRQSADQLIREHAATAEPFTVDDLRGALPEPEIPQHWGAVFAAARNRGTIYLAGFTLHREPSGEMRALRVWKGIPGGEVAA